MWDEIKTEELLDYTEIVNLSNKDKSNVYLVLNRNKNHMAIRKKINKGLYNIYCILKITPHTNLPKVYCVMEEKDHIVVLEEYIEGVTLEDILGGKRLIDENMLLNIMQQLCNALTVLHELPYPIIHRDIKPSNLIINKYGALKLIDFDASREYKKASSRDTINLGTLEYAAPEQFGFSQTDNRSDIYSMGKLIADFLLKANKSEKPYQHQEEIKKVVDKCTMFDPNQRYQTVNELKKAINKIDKENSNQSHLVQGWVFMLALFVFIVIALITAL